MTKYLEKMTKFSVQPIYRPFLRTAGLSSVKASMFGMTRKNPDGSLRPHQGVDFGIDNGYRVYAVENGIIVDTAMGKDGYGYTITLKLDCPQKPELHGKFAFYAHLNRIDIVIGQKVIAGTPIALTGDTGNAKGMTTIAKGGHLHFELRTQQICGKGLAGRIDPLPFIELDG